MEEKINELKSLIETLAEDSTLRKELQDALDAELKRAGQAPEGAAEETADEEEEKSDDFKFSERLERHLKELEHSDSIIGKLEALMEDEEFITASAGFVLGAAVVGAGVLAYSFLKK